ncbi:Nop14-like family protein [Pleurostoma richardsiae]|uniref:Nop14-like family protein n=1 Tax=Pleurostoma richardsiae TaxID=41990 RepID=A0AA38VMS0_9PEZI|nr:Nop14-like family protein [Pleurostoma richardsiae]
MPSSQLKRLKASLKDQGIIGPQQSKKQKKKQAQDQRARNEKRLQRGAALESIREQFNPFQFKTNARGPKFDVTTNRPATGAAAKGINGRPGQSKALGEERRRETLLVEMQQRNKVGGILDRRFGEDNPTITPEAIMAERFAREKLRQHKKASIFDLEEDMPVQGLTHMGMSLDDDPVYKDDFDEDDLGSDDGSDVSDNARSKLKRLREEIAADEEENADDGLPERKKTKQEVMKEIIAKSKLHKYERQVAKEEDEDLRAELDKELPNLHSLLMGGPRKGRQDQQQNGAVPSAIAGIDKAALGKEYDLSVKQLAADKRAKPALRTKTEEEKAEEESKRLRELEEKRVKRMLGQKESDDEESDEEEDKDIQNDSHPDFEVVGAEEEAEFALGKGVRTRLTAAELGFDDEDDFLLDDDLIASGSDISDEDEDDASFDGEGDRDDAASASDDDEFTKGLLTEAETNDPIFSKGGAKAGTTADEDGLPYTFPCPQDHSQFLELVEGVPLSKLIVVIQRIRALYHPKLNSDYKEKLANFSRALVRHISYLGEATDADAYAAAEGLIRHVHSLAKMFPIEVAKEFRSLLVEMGEERPLSLTVGDLLVLTAIGSIFPTSDHFHQVATPATLTIARYLGQKVPQRLSDYAIGSYLTILTLQYQSRAQRYVPELMNFCLNTLCALSPEKYTERVGFFPLHEPVPGIRIKGAKKAHVRKLECSDCRPSEDASSGATESLKASVANTTIRVLATAAETWAGKSAFYETFLPAVKVLKQFGSKACRPHLPDSLVQEAERSATMLERMLKVAQLSRRPLELHHHKPLAIKTYVPKFEDKFDPNKHYDPDRERAELAKLRAEHKKERKGAMRELRKDANFMARERLRLKKDKDAAYEKKYKRIVAEIQTEEGREANAYERERQLRRKANKRG